MNKKFLGKNHGKYCLGTWVITACTDILVKTYVQFTVKKTSYMLN